ncbi:hypothetical protein KKH38_04245 [Patescibacteria group bacterium]|nr:hypothetical protein [Patescibacteria group bacterium]MBU4601227.1 hypothetical protein [Patescibacteria group bacterium]MCG2697620.1 hypothetical protein [Candidatus Parcubacteria bacterium]
MPLDILSKTPIPDKLPKQMQETINELKKSLDKNDCLKQAYEILTAKYRGQRIKTYTKLFNVFSKDIDKMWSQTGFLHCANINYLMRTLLIKSGFFNNSDIALKWTMVWHVSPHQYIHVIINNKKINIDVWASSRGIKFGDYAHGFH